MGRIFKITPNKVTPQRPAVLATRAARTAARRAKRHDRIQGMIERMAVFQRDMTQVLAGVLGMRKNGD